LRSSWLRALISRVAATPDYGSSNEGAGRRVQVEFVSTNPTGPLHIGHGRGAILGDVLSRLLAFTGHDVQREYYVNDYGTQARRFGESIYARLTNREPPTNGYVGEYVTDLARQASRDIPELEGLAPDRAIDALREYGAARMIGEFKETLGRIGVRYDCWYSEKSLWDDGLAPRAIERLRKAGYLNDRDGAVWFTSIADQGREDEGDEEERVVFRRDGTHTYFASDLGYLLSRFETRRFDRVIEVWGADHHGYVPRIKAGAAALGLNSEELVIIINQMVNLTEGKMSKRKGRFVTLNELIDRVGVDAVRYFYLLRSPDAMMDFDLQLAVEQSSENPVYYAQYAHARLFNVERTAAETHGEIPETPDLELLDKPWELSLARSISYWPDVVATAARLLEPHRLPYYVHELADAVHVFYQAGNEDPAHRVIVPDPAITRARLELCRAARVTLRAALDLIGVAAPERM
jgi:arginyl-tRNA synthetase